MLDMRTVFNYSRNGTSVNYAVINQYFDNLEEPILDIPVGNISNYDETNWTDNPGKQSASWEEYLSILHAY